MAIGVLVGLVLSSVAFGMAVVLTVVLVALIVVQHWDADQDPGARGGWPPTVIGPRGPGDDD